MLSVAPAATILVVDDEDSIQEMLRERLSMEGYACDTCGNGDVALQLLAQRHYDLILSDLNMPGINGLELLREVRRRYPTHAFLMATAVQDFRVAVQAMKEGAQDYLVKPFQLELVIAEIKRALERRRMELELNEYRQRLEGMVDERTRQLSEALEQVELTYDQTLQALGMALDLRAREVAGHSLRVSRYCLELARVLGYPNEQLRRLARAAYLHDIGKLGIPDAILLKPAPLNEQEREIMRAHVRIGWELVNRIALLAQTAELVLTHQEHFDGTGYPQGLKGEEIPLDSRVFSVADALDAMISDRAYRKALSFAVARQEIVAQSGRQFDPRVVEAFLSIPERRWHEIGEELLERYGPEAQFPSTSELVSRLSSDLQGEPAAAPPPVPRAQNRAAGA